MWEFIHSIQPVWLAALGCIQLEIICSLGQSIQIIGGEVDTHHVGLAGVPKVSLQFELVDVVSQPGLTRHELCAEVSLQEVRWQLIQHLIETIISDHIGGEIGGHVADHCLLLLCSW